MSDPAEATPLPRLTMDRLENIRDFYIFDTGSPHDVKNAFCFTGSPIVEPVMDQPIEPWVDGLLSHVRRKHPDDVDFLVSYEDRYFFRGHRIPSRTGTLIALRRIPDQTPLLSDLIMPTLWAELLLHKSLLSGGLILICAVTGQGKSTTVSAIIRSRLEKYAGFALTVEDPLEAPLHGPHGNGFCVQTQVDYHQDQEDAYAEALRGAMRSYPTSPGGGTILLVGEVRDPVTACEVIRAAVNGHLVITTIHAGDIPTAISRLRALAAQQLGHEPASDLLSSALKIAIHQTLTLDPNGKGWQRGRIGGEFLWSADNTSPVAQAIKEGKAASLNQSVAAQQSFIRRIPRPSVEEFIKRFETGGG